MCHVLEWNDESQDSQSWQLQSINAPLDYFPMIKKMAKNHFSGKPAGVMVRDTAPYIYIFLLGFPSRKCIELGIQKIADL